MYKYLLELFLREVKAQKSKSLYEPWNSFDFSLSWNKLTLGEGTCMQFAFLVFFPGIPKQGLTYFQGGIQLLLLLFFYDFRENSSNSSC